MKSELKYYAKGVLTTALISAVLAPLFMYGVTPESSVAIPAAVVACFTVYGFWQFFRHKPVLRGFRCVRFLGLFWAITLLPFALLGITEAICPPSISGPMNNSMFEFTGIVICAPALVLELVAVTVFYLLGGGKPNPLARRINPELARQINENLSQHG